MVKITLDGKSLEVDENGNLLEEFLSRGEDLPYFCWHPSMGSVGSCRQCAIIEYAGEEDQRGRLNMACMTAPREGGRYSIAKAAKFRAQVIESLMINHPHDCPVCEEGGECHLQDMTVMSGHVYRRYDGKKATHRNQYLGPFINHEMNRCIACYRCARYYQDYAGGTDFSVQASHHHVYFGRYREGPFASEFSGNLVEVCPTGVFTDKPFSRHYVRKWDLQTAPSLCAACGVGCNTSPGERYGALRRVVNRFNEAVNGYFLCDRGRFGAEYVNSQERIRVSMTRPARESHPSPLNPDEARSRLHEAAQGAIGIGSPRASMEANFALRDLVGAENFHAGLSDVEYDLLQLILEVYRQGPAKIASIRDMEQADAVLVLGEDLTNTAPRIALALRQAVKNLGRTLAADLKIPAWHDAAVRQLTMDRKSPLYLASPHATRLDDIAAATLIRGAEDSARLGFAIAHAIDASAPAPTGLSEADQTLAEEIAAALKNASRPLIISGAGSLCPALIQAAANVATALHGAGGSKGKRPKRRAKIALLAPEANSLGLALLAGQSGGQLGVALTGGARRAIVLENDLYRRAPDAQIDAFIGQLEHLAVLDSLRHRTGEQANLVLAAGTFAESSGTLVNYEGRAQYFHAVFKPADPIKPSAWWLSERSMAELSEACAKTVPGCEGMARIRPDPAWNVAGLKAPRQPSRYSGRTAMRAHLNVHEAKQEQDENGLLAYSMEGAPSLKDSTLLASSWAPGWNSNQSIFKFQEQTGGALRDGSSGELLIAGKGPRARKAWHDFPPSLQGAGEESKSHGKGRNKHQYWVFPLHHIFGSEELSARSPAIQARSTDAYAALNGADAKSLKVGEGDGLMIAGQGPVPVIIRDSLAPGTVGLSVGLSGLNFHNVGLGAAALQKAENWVGPEGWKPENILVSDRRAP